MDKFHYHIFNY